jgi:hypothetical protein
LEVLVYIQPPLDITRFLLLIKIGGCIGDRTLRSWIESLTLTIYIQTKNLNKNLSWCSHPDSNWDSEETVFKTVAST